MLKSIFKIGLLSAVIFSSSSCSSTRFVVPLDDRQQAISAEFGGPLLNFAGTTIPTPLASVTHAYGINKNLTVHNSVHLTSLAYGTFHLESGLLRNLFYAEKPRIGFSYSPGVNLMIDRFEWNFRVYPQLDMNLYWFITGQGDRNCDCPGAEGKRPLIFYTGSSTWFEFSQTKAHGLDQEKNIFINPQVGMMYMGKKLNYQLEAKWLYSSRRNDNLVPDYVGINNRGAVGVYLTISKFLNHGV